MLYSNLSHRLELEKDLEEYETEQQVNAQYVEEFAMLTSEKVSCHLVCLQSLNRENRNQKKFMKNRRQTREKKTWAVAKTSCDFTDLSSALNLVILYVSWYLFYKVLQPCMKEIWSPVTVWMNNSISNMMSYFLVQLCFVCRKISFCFTKIWSHSWRKWNGSHLHWYLVVH